MVRHVLLLRPHPGASPPAIEAARQAITSLVGRIPGLIDCHWGENFASIERAEGLTHGFTMDFVERESLIAYGPHPDHKEASALLRAAFGHIIVLDLVLETSRQGP